LGDVGKHLEADHETAIAPVAGMNAMEPGVNGRVSAKAMGRFEGLHEGFLDQVLGFGFVAAKQTGGTEQPIAVRFNQLLKIKGLRRLEGGNALKFSHPLSVPQAGKRFNFARQDSQGAVMQSNCPTNQEQTPKNCGGPL